MIDVLHVCHSSPCGELPKYDGMWSQILVTQSWSTISALTAWLEVGNLRLYSGIGGRILTQCFHYVIMNFLSVYSFYIKVFDNISDFFFGPFLKVIPTL